MVLRLIRENILTCYVVFIILISLFNEVFQQAAAHRSHVKGVKIWLITMCLWTP